MFVLFERQQHTTLTTATSTTTRQKTAPETTDSMATGRVVCGAACQQWQSLLWGLQKRFLQQHAKKPCCKHRSCQRVRQPLQALHHVTKAGPVRRTGRPASGRELDQAGRSSGGEGGARAVLQHADHCGARQACLFACVG